MTFNHSTKAWKFYVNGSQQGTTQTASSGTTYNSTAQFSVGDRGTGGVQGLNGKLDMVGAWNVELASSDITALYNSGAGKQYPFNTIYTLATLPASFSYTAQSEGLHRIINQASAVTSFIFTGAAITFSRAKTYLLACLPTSFTFTGMSTGLKRLLTIITSPATYSFVGQAITIAITKVYKLICLPAVYLFSGLGINIKAPWVNQTKHSSSWTNQSKDSSSWTNQNKN